MPSTASKPPMPPRRGSAVDVFFKQQMHILKKPSYRRTMEDIYVLQKCFAGIAFFKDLEPIIRTQVCRALMLEQFGAQQIVFREGETGDKFYIIVSGSVGVFIKEVGAQDVEDNEPRHSSSGRIGFNVSKNRGSFYEEEEDLPKKKRKKSILKVSALIPEDEEVADTASDPGDSKKERLQSLISTPAVVKGRKSEAKGRKDPSRFSSAPPVSLSSERGSLLGDAPSTRLSLAQSGKRSTLNPADAEKKRDSCSHGPPSHAASRALVPRRRGSAMDENSDNFDRRGSAQTGGAPGFRRTSATQRPSLSSAADGRRGSASVRLSISGPVSAPGMTPAVSRRPSHNEAASAHMPGLGSDNEHTMVLHEEETSDEKHLSAPSSPSSPKSARSSIRRSFNMLSMAGQPTSLTEATIRKSLRRGSFEDQTSEWLETVQHNTLATQAARQLLLPGINVKEADSGSPDESEPSSVLELTISSDTLRRPSQMVQFKPCLKSDGPRSSMVCISPMPTVQEFEVAAKSRGQLIQVPTSALARRTSRLAPQTGALSGSPSAEALNSSPRRVSMQVPQPDFLERRKSSVQVLEPIAFEDSTCSSPPSQEDENETEEASNSSSRRISAPAFLNAQSTKSHQLLRRQSTVNAKNLRRLTHTSGEILLSKLEKVNESGSENSLSSSDSDKSEPTALEIKVRSSGTMSPRRWSGGHGEGGNTPKDSGSEESSGDSLDSRMSEVSDCPSLMSTSSRLSHHSHHSHHSKLVSRSSSTSSLSMKPKSERGTLNADGESPSLKPSPVSSRQSSRQSSKQLPLKKDSNAVAQPGRSCRGTKAGSLLRHQLAKGGLGEDSSNDGSSSESNSSSSSSRSGNKSNSDDSSSDSSSGSSSDSSEENGKANGATKSKSNESHSGSESSGGDLDEDEAKARTQIMNQALTGGRRVSLWLDDELPPEILAGSRKSSVAYQSLPAAESKSSKKPKGKFAKLRRTSHLEKLMPKMMEVAVLMPGAAFGEVALQTDQPRSATVKTKEDCFFAVLTRDEYKSILQNVFEKQARERQDFLANLPLLAGLPRPAINKMAAMLQQRTLTKNQFVYDCDMPVLQVFFAKEGEFAVRCRRMQHDDGLGSGEPKSVAGTRNSFSMPSSKKGDDRLLKTKDQFLTVALLKPPCVFGLSGYMRGERKYTHRVVCQSLSGTVYCLLAKELIYHLPRDCRDQLHLSAGAENMFYDNRSLVLRQLHAPVRRRRELRGQRRWRPEVSVSERLKLFRGEVHENEAWKYSVEQRLAAMGSVFKQAEQETVANENALVSQIPSDKAENLEVKEQSADIRQSSIQACWWVEHVAVSGKHGGDRSCSPNQNNSPEPRSTRSVSPDRKGARSPDSEADAALVTGKPPLHDTPAEDAKLALAFDKQVFHCPSPEVLRISDLARRTPVPPKGTWHPAELAFEENVYKPSSEALYGSAAWLKNKKDSIRCANSLEQLEQPQRCMTAPPPRCMTATPTPRKMQPQNGEDLQDVPLHETPSTAAPSSPLRDFSPVHQSTLRRQCRTPASPERFYASQGHHAHDSRYCKTFKQEELPKRAQTSQDYAIGCESSLPDQPDVFLKGGRGAHGAKYITSAKQQNLPVRAQSSQDYAVGDSSSLWVQPLSTKPCPHNLQPVSEAGKASAVQSLAGLGLFADHLVQSTTLNSPDADLQGKSTQIRSALSRGNPRPSPAAAADRALPVNDLQRVYKRPGAGANDRPCAMEAPSVFESFRSQTPRSMQFRKGPHHI